MVGYDLTRRGLIPLTKAIEKLKKYYKKLEAGRTDKIKPSHVVRVIEKLKAKKESLQDEIAVVEKAEKKERLEQKLAMTKEQIKRAKWLLEHVRESDSAKPNS